jgi:formylglycine-generating enzyme required for sulfatase activity
MRLRPEELRTGSRERLFSSVRRPIRLAWAAPLIVLFLLSIVWLLDRKPQGQASKESHSAGMRLQDPAPQAASSPEQVKQQEFDDNVSMARSALARQDPRAAAGYIEKAEKLEPSHKDLLSVKNEYQAALVELERKLDDDAFGQAVRGGAIESFKAYLDRYPNGNNASKARDLLAKLEIAAQLEESRIAEEKARLKAALDDEAFQKAKQAGTEKAFEGYLHDFPEGRHANAARELASFLADQAREAASAPKESEKAGEYQAGETMLIKIGDAVLTMVWVPPGKFQMGSSSINASRNEKPVHSVKISNGYWIGKYEVTQDQWIAVMGTDPIIAPSAVLKPATSVSWEEAQLFIKELNRMTGRIFRLPTEAEWEYACRAGAADDWYGEWNAIAWTYANAKGRLQVVGQKRPNAFGLHDMIGNVWEWCQDWYAARYYRESPPADPQGPSSGEKKTVRGGSYRNYPENANSATRGSAKLDEKKDDIGVRLLLEEKGNESGPPIFLRLQT